MKNKEETMEKHSPEVKKILETPPAWIVRWGTLLITLVLVTTVLIMWLGFV